MNGVSREQGLLDAFGTLADTLVADYDVVELLQSLVETCRELLDTTAVGLLLADPATGALDLVASTSEEAGIVETIQLGAEAGPCVECFHTARVVSVADIRDAPDTWHAFRDRALELGFGSITALPLRLRDTTIGSMNLFRVERGELNDRDLRAAQALADVATIGILNERTFRASDVLRQQLQVALGSRVVVEQAKGVLAHTHQLSMDAAFQRLRDYARANRLPLAEVARALVERRLTF